MESKADSDSFFEHLSEFRSRLIYSLWGILLGMLISFTFSEFLFAIIRRPIADFLPQGGLVFTGPLDKFLAHIKISILSGVVLTCPFWLLQSWKFIAPGLYQKEKKFALGFIGSGSLLFLTGVFFAYFGVFPMAFKFLMTFGGEIDKPMITIDQYLSFFVTTTLMFGLAFEIPLVLVVLGMLGIVDQAFLKKYRRYSIMILSILAAVITPPDLFSMVMMLVPMIILYEVSVFFVGFFEQRRKSADI